MKVELADAVTSPPDLLARLSAIEADLYQVKNASPKNKIANPIKLSDRLAGLLWLVQTGDAAPNAAQRAVARALIDELPGHLARLSQLPAAVGDCPLPPRFRCSFCGPKSAVAAASQKLQQFPGGRGQSP